MADTADVTELYDEEVDEVHGVGSPANGMSFLVLKSQPVAKATWSTAFVNGAAAKNAGIEVSKADGADIPGTPAWEAVDAVTAQAAVQALQSLRQMVCAMRDREATEVAMGDDDCDDVFALDQVDGALDCALTLLARFSVDEAEESSTGFAVTDDDLAFVAKAGRRLSTATESALRQAMATMQAVLDGTLIPTKPTDGASGAAQKEDAMSDETTDDTTDVAKATAEDDTAKSAPTDDDAKVTADDGDGADDVVKAQQALAEAQARLAAAEAAVGKADPASAVLKSDEFATVLKSTLEGVVKEALGDALKPLEDRLAVVEAQPMPGGPVLKGKAATMTAEQYKDMVQPRGGDPLEAELAPVLKALEAETDARRIAELRTEESRIKLRRLYGGS